MFRTLELTGLLVASFTDSVSCKVVDTRLAMNARYLSVRHFMMNILNALLLMYTPGGYK